MKTPREEVGDLVFQLNALFGKLCGRKDTPVICGQLLVICRDTLHQKQDRFPDTIKDAGSKSS